MILKLLEGSLTIFTPNGYLLFGTVGCRSKGSDLLRGSQATDPAAGVGFRRGGTIVGEAKLAGVLGLDDLEHQSTN